MAARMWKLRDKYPCFLAFLVFATLRWIVNFGPIWTGNLELYNTLYWWGRPLYVLFAGCALAECATDENWEADTRWMVYASMLAALRAALKGE